jgi:hypothetical protein
MILGTIVKEYFWEGYFVAGIVGKERFFVG